MDILEYQDQAQRTLNKGLEYPELLQSLLLGLNGEVGELTDIYKKILYHDHPMKQSDIEEEIGDVLWYIINLITIEGFSIENILIQNIEKLKKRYPNGFNSDDSIKRVDTKENKKQKLVNIDRTCFNNRCEHCDHFTLLCQKLNLSNVQDCNDYLSRNIKSNKLKEEEPKHNLTICYNRSCPYCDENTLMCKISHASDTNECYGYKGNNKKEELIKPTYYNDTKISPFDYIRENDLNFFEGNIVKYITRHKEKNKIEDLIKAKTYIDEILKNYDKIYK